MTNIKAALIVAVGPGDCRAEKGGIYTVTPTTALDGYVAYRMNRFNRAIFSIPPFRVRGPVREISAPSKIAIPSSAGKDWGDLTPPTPLVAVPNVIDLTPLADSISRKSKRENVEAKR